MTELQFLGELKLKPECFTKEHKKNFTGKFILLSDRKQMFCDRSLMFCEFNVSKA